MKGVEVMQCISVTLWVISFHILYIDMFFFFCSCHWRNKWSNENIRFGPVLLPMEIEDVCFVSFCCFSLNSLKELYNNMKNSSSSSNNTSLAVNIGNRGALICGGVFNRVSNWLFQSFCINSMWSSKVTFGNTS